MYATIYLDKEPTAEECEAFYSDPVRVPNEDGSFHWEALITKATYDNAKLSAKAPAVFSTCDAKFKCENGTPRHVFGAPGNVNDPEVKEKIVEVKDAK